MYKSELELAKLAAKQAVYYLENSKHSAVDDFSNKDIKLTSDINSESIIIKQLEKSGIPILSEESGFSGKGSGLRWLVDPIDGTMNYYKGIKELSAISIALWDDNQPILGVVHRLKINEIFSGIVGQKAYLNGVEITPSNVFKVKDAVLATGFPVKRNYSSESLAKFINNIQRFKKIRMFGAASLMGVFVACGKIDLYIEEDIMSWDIAAAAAIICAAGGEIDIIFKENNKCLCSFFANQKLQEDYNAQSI